VPQAMTAVRCYTRPMAALHDTVDPGQLLYNAPHGRKIEWWGVDDETGELVVGLDDGTTDRVQIGKPQGTTLQ
jgi:hypothetical protein